ncbi:MAG: hypothetical protein EHM13_12050, partial [Acidobacteria bacterium]
MKTQGLHNRVGGVLRQGPGVLQAATAFATGARVRMALRTREAPSITSDVAVLLSTAVFAIAVMSQLAVVYARFGPAPDGGASSPTVSTDKADYGPSETVMVSGSGFGAGETLSV